MDSIIIVMIIITNNIKNNNNNENYNGCNIILDVLSSFSRNNSQEHVGETGNAESKIFQVVC